MTSDPSCSAEDGCSTDSDVAIAVWSGGLLVAIIGGSLINLLVILHWFFSRPCNCSPSAALPFADFLMCILGAPIRYSQEMYTSSPGNDLSDEAISNGTTYTGQENAEESSSDGGTTIVLCLTSLHVVSAVAMYRLLFVVNCVPQKQSREGKPIVPILVLVACFVFSILVFITFYFCGGLTGKLIILNVDANNFSYRGGSSGVSFLIYTLSICFTTVACYLVLVCSLVYHELLSNKQEGSFKLNPIQKIRDSLVCPGRIIQDDPRLNQLQLQSINESQEDRQMAAARQELRGRAFCSITGLLVALVICWILPISLSLHAFFAADIQLIDFVPRMDALIFLSAVVHPFLYGEAWLAIPFCINWSKRILDRA